MSKKMLLLSKKKYFLFFKSFILIFSLLFFFPLSGSQLVLYQNIKKEEPKENIFKRIGKRCLEEVLDTIYFVQRRHKVMGGIGAFGIGYLLSKYRSFDPGKENFFLYNKKLSFPLYVFMHCE
jgi:hypothetical protein